jgi:hypothetical protein
MLMMIRRICVEYRLICMVTSVALAGCRIEIEQNEGYLPIAGRVTYRGQPVRRGAIHFLPAGGDNLPGSGVIDDGEIKEVTSRNQGDGLKPGLYRVSITAFDDTFAENAAKRGPNGPDPREVGKDADRIKGLIPPRYNNAKDSGLVAEVSKAVGALRFDLVD